MGLQLRQLIEQVRELSLQVLFHGLAGLGAFSVGVAGLWQTNHNLDEQVFRGNNWMQARGQQKSPGLSSLALDLVREHQRFTWNSNSNNSTYSGGDRQVICIQDARDLWHRPCPNGPCPASRAPFC